MPEYRLRILKEADACRKPGEVGALLRREGTVLVAAMTNWRRQREAGALREMRGRRRGPTLGAHGPTREAARDRRTTGSSGSCQRAETIITLQKKVAEILGIPLTPHDDDATD